MWHRDWLLPTGGGVGRGRMPARTRVMQTSIESQQQPLRQPPISTLLPGFASSADKSCFMQAPPAPLRPKPGRHLPYSKAAIRDIHHPLQVPGSGRAWPTREWWWEGVWLLLNRLWSKLLQPGSGPKQGSAPLSNWNSMLSRGVPTLGRALRNEEIA